MKKKLASIICLLLFFKTHAQLVHETMATENSTEKLIELSQQLLYAVKTQQDYTSYTKALQATSLNTIAVYLTTDEHKKAFWLNLYNAFVQIMAKQNTTAYQNRHTFFTGKYVVFSNKKISLDFIEHTLLRRGKIKWSLGYLNSPFITNLQRKLRLEQMDYRIHFALNCGAKSCPPIAFYDATKIDEQLNLATKNYLKQQVSYLANENKLIVPKIMQWFIADFGNKKGIRKILADQKIIPTNSKPTIKYAAYNWTLTLHQFQ